MIVSNKHKFAYVHIQKTGGTSITLMLVPYLDKEPARTQGRGWQALCHKTGLHSGITPHLNTRYKNHFKFTMVRNPYDRVLSMWRSGFNRAKSSFDDYCNRIKNGGGFRKQTSFFTTSDDEVLVDYVARYENYEEEIKKIHEKIGIPIPLEIPHRLNTKVRKRQAIFNPARARIIFDAFEKDFEILGYDKDSWHKINDGINLPS